MGQPLVCRHCGEDYQTAYWDEMRAIWEDPKAALPSPVVCSRCVRSSPESDRPIAPSIPVQERTWPDAPEVVTLHKRCQCGKEWDGPGFGPRRPDSVWGWCDACIIEENAALQRLTAPRPIIPPPPTTLQRPILVGEADYD